MKIFAGGIVTETNTFAPLRTTLEDFRVQRRGDVCSARAQDLSVDLWGAWGRQATEAGHAFVFGLMAWAEPAGITTRASFESLRDELLARARAAMPIDVALLMLHGAMIADGYDDCEEDIIRRMRAIVGPAAVIGVELDLHCHLRQSMIDQADIVITYKKYPHSDINERATEVFNLAVRAKLGAIRPVMALFDCRMVGMYPTSKQPLRGFVDAMSQAEGRERTLSVSFGHGFQFADVPHVGAKVLVITDDDPVLATQLARDFGRQVYGMRREIGFDNLSLPMEEALAKALEDPRTPGGPGGQVGPVVVADQSDNTGGGAPGDATFVLRWLLEHRIANVALGIFYDPQVVRIAKAAGTGATIPVRLGGKSGPHSGDPLDLEVSVLASRDSYMHSWPQRSGEPVQFPAGDVVALRCGDIDILVSSERCQCFSPSIFADLGIDPLTKRLLVVKSYQHFHDAFSTIAAKIVYMAAPGAVMPDPRRIPYRRLDTSRLYPWVQDPLGADASTADMR